MAENLMTANRPRAAKMPSGRVVTATETDEVDTGDDESSPFAPPIGAFGEWFRAEREKRRVSVGAIVLLSGLSKNYIYRVEEGKVRPSRDVAGRLSLALGADKEDGLMAAYFLPKSLSALQNSDVRRLALIYDSLPPKLQLHVMHVAEAATDMAQRLSLEREDSPVETTNIEGA